MRNLMVLCAIILMAPMGCGNDDSSDNQKSSSQSKQDESCPALEPIECADGEVLVSKTDPQTGCVIGFECDPCPLLDQPNGTCAGKWVPSTDANGCVTGFDCVICSTISDPPEGFCPQGTVEPKLDEQGCQVGWQCSTTCPLVEPPECPNGTLEPIVDSQTGCTTGYNCI